MITKKEWEEFLRLQYRSLNLENDNDMSAFCMLATVEEFLRRYKEID